MKQHTVSLFTEERASINLEWSRSYERVEKVPALW
jgi:hypothetical protein